MSAIPESVKKISAQELANLTAAEATKVLEIDLAKNPKHVVNGAGAAVFYKIGNEFYIVGGYRNNKFLWVNGGQVKGNILEQIKKEFEEETFNVLQLTDRAKMQNMYYADSQNFGTYVSFVYIDTTSFSSKEELDARIATMNPSAGFYNELFLHVTANRGEKILTPEEHSAKTEELIERYLSLTAQGLLLVDVAGSKKEQFFAELRALKSIGGVKEWYKTENDAFIKRYKIGEYSERSHYEALTLGEFKARLDKANAGDKTQFFGGHTAIATLMPEIERAIANVASPRVYSERSGSPALYQPAPTAQKKEEPVSSFALSSPSNR